MNQILMILSLSFFCVFGQQSAFADSKYQIKWVLAHQPARVFEKAAQEFAKRVEEKTKGQVKVEILKEKPDGQAFDVGEAFKKVQSGEIQMSQTYTTFLGNYDKQMWILDLPFLFKNHQHATHVLDGSIGKKLLNGLSKAEVQGLAFTYSGGYRVIPTKSEPLLTAESLKGKKIGVAKDSPVAQAYLRQLGAIPVPVTDTASSMDPKADGFETTYARLSGIKKAPAKYLNETEHTLFLTAIVINEKYFKDLPLDIQKAISETALDVAKIEREDSIKDNLESRDQFLKENKAQLIKMKETEVALLKKASEPVYRTYSKILNSDVIDLIQKAE